MRQQAERDDNPGTGREWLLLAAFLGALALGIGVLRWQAYRVEDSGQRARLTSQLRSMDENLGRQLHGADAALRALRGQVGSGELARLGVHPVKELQALASAMPGVRALLVLDREGRAVLADPPQLIGRDFGAAPHFRKARERNDPRVLMLSPPVPGASGAQVMNLTLAWQDGERRFAGAVVATLDPQFFQTVLSSAIYAPDMWAAVAHDDGGLLMFVPQRQVPDGTRLDRPGSMFLRHRESGLVETVFAGTVALSGEDRLMAQRTVLPEGLPLDHGLVLALTRDRDAMFAAWRETTGGYVAFMLLLASGTAGGLHLLQRRRAAELLLRRQSAERERLDAERLALALGAADLGLWDVDIASGNVVVNARWRELFGLEPDRSTAATVELWRRCVHPDDLPRVLDLQREHLRGETPAYEASYRVRRADGRWVWILDRGRVLSRDAGGRALRMVGTHMDLTARVQAEQALRDRERQLSAITDALPGPVSRVDAEGRYLFANVAYERWFGRRADEVVGRTQREVLGPHYARVEAYVQRAMAGETVHYETPVQARHGPLHALVTLVPDLDEAGRVRGHFTIVADITARKHAEDALRAAEQRTRMLLDMLASGVVVHAPDTRIVDGNPAACEILGLTRDQMEGKAAIDPAWHFVEEDGTPIPLERYPVNQVIASGAELHDFILGLRRPDRADLAWVRVDATPALDAQGRLEQVVVTFVDITQRVQAQGHLRLLEGAIARLHDMVIITEVPPPGDDAWQRIVYVNEAFERVTGYPRHEALGRDPRFLQGPDTDRGDVARVGRAVRRLEAVHAELLNYSRDGRPYWVELDIVPIADAAGRITHMVAVERDVTDRRQAQATLRAAQEDLAATVAAIPDLLFEYTLDGRIESCHSPREDQLVVPAAAQIGRNVREVLPPEAAEEVLQALAEAHLHGRSGGHQYALTLPDGVLHWFEVSVAGKPGAQPRFVLLARDITDRRRAESERRTLEAQLRESQKMEAIGTLAGGIAHDFNNVVAGILGNAALLRDDLGGAHPAMSALEQIERAGRRARALVRRILAFSRREAVPFAALPLREVMQEPLALLRATLPPGVRLVEVLGDEPVHVHGDATQLQQVLMNLCVNALQALPASGGLVEVGLEAGPDAARGAHVWVSDNGCGMDEATVLRIFDPFFTTKGPGLGTGIGLAVVRGIVDAHGGRIVVDSTPGAGTTFHVYLPSVATRGPALHAEADAAAPPVGGGQHLLYVDDDEIMRTVVPRLLERAGWRVSTAAGAAEALALLAAPGQDIALVVSDMSMPEVSGLELCRQIAALRPGLPTLISSGHLSEDLLANAAAAGVRKVLHKEDMLETLVPAIAALLPAAAEVHS